MNETQAGKAVKTDVVHASLTEADLGGERQEKRVQLEKRQADSSLCSLGLERWVCNSWSCAQVVEV